MIEAKRTTDRERGKRKILLVILIYMIITGKGDQKNYKSAG